MSYKTDSLDGEKLKTIMKARGFKEREFCVIMWGDDTHRTINEFKRRPNTTIETAMKVCNTLDISLDELFSGSDKIGDSSYLIGDQKIVNSDVIHPYAKSLQSENKALRMLVKEKDERISDLKKVNGQMESVINMLRELGQNSDTK